MVIFVVRGRKNTERGFSVEKIRIEGNEKVSDEEILVLTGVREGKRLLEAEKHAMHEKLLEHPWIGDVRIRESFGGTLVIAVKEHAPIAILRRSAPTLLCSDGATIPFDERFADLPTVFIHGKMDFSSAATRIAMIQEILGGKGSLAIHFRGNEGTYVECAGAKLLIGTNEPLPLKGEVASAVEEMKEKGYHICDMRFKDQIIFEKGGAL
jgi:hypothetical protein